MTFVESYHVGIAVAHLDVTMQQLSELLGVRWAASQRRDFRVRTREAEIDAAFRFTYSTPASGAALIELIEGPPGTPWWPGEGISAAFHHLGFWDADIESTVARLDAGGAPLEATVVDEDSLRRFAYHQPSAGPRIELVDAARRPAFLSWLAGEGDFPQQ
jgi:hypothetical protein